MAMSVELLAKSIAWQAASRPTLRLVLSGYTVSAMSSDSTKPRLHHAGRALLHAGSFRKRGARSLRRRLDAGRASRQPSSRPRSPSSARAPSSRTTTRPTSASTARSIRTAAASTAASIATPGRATPISSSRRAWTSRPSSSPRPTPPSCCARRSPSPATSRSPIALGANTDCYQPIERKYRITRQILEVLAECEHPVTMVTKSALVERDLDLLGPMAQKNLVQRLRLDRHARPRARAQARAARGEPATAPGYPAKPVRRQSALRRDGGGADSGAERQDHGARARGRGAPPARARRPTSSCGCRTS